MNSSGATLRMRKQYAVFRGLRCERSIRDIKMTTGLEALSVRNRNTPSPKHKGINGPRSRADKRKT